MMMVGVKTWHVLYENGVAMPWRRLLLVAGRAAAIWHGRRGGSPMEAYGDPIGFAAERDRRGRMMMLSSCILDVARR